MGPQPHIVDIKDDPDAFFFSVTDDSWEIDGRDRRCGVGNRPEFRAVPAGIEEHILEMMTRGEVDTVETGLCSKGGTDQFAGEDTGGIRIPRWG